MTRARTTPVEFRHSLDALRHAVGGSRRLRERLDERLLRTGGEADRDDEAGAHREQCTVVDDLHAFAEATSAREDKMTLNDLLRAPRSYRAHLPNVVTRDDFAHARDEALEKKK